MYYLDYQESLTDKEISKHLIMWFSETHSTQHALFKLLQAWQEELDTSGFVDTILMNSFKTYLRIILFV